VIVLDNSRRHIPGDRAVIDEMLDRDQYAAKIDRMAVCHVEVSDWYIVGERTAPHDDRSREAVAPRNQAAATTDPNDRFRHTRKCQHPISDLPDPGPGYRRAR